MKSASPSRAKKRWSLADPNIVRLLKMLRPYKKWIIYAVIALAVTAGSSSLIAMLLGFSPKFGALIHTIPGPVIGGASIVVFGLIAVAGARIWVQNRVDLSQNSNLIMVSVTLVLGAGDFALSLGGFTLGGIGTATFGAILLHALLHRGTREAKEARVTPV